MILLAFLLLGLIAGLVSGGKISNLAHINIRMLWMPVVSFAIKGIVPMLLLFFGLPYGVFQIPVCILQYLLLLLFVFFNWRTGVWSFVFGTGAFMNFLVILLNGGAMPVSQKVLQNAPELSARLANGDIFAYTLGTSATRLPFLGDIIWMNLGSNFSGFASLGDFFIGLGIGLLAFKLVRTKAPAKQEEEKLPEAEKQDEQ
ncbi:MAG: DUF5317 domain-containing protein [Oscillospiraceae bacterium]